jgi:hypothetical protein
MYLAFIDESGNHNLDIVKVDNLYNVFVLGAVLFEEQDYLLFDTQFRQMKRKLFGTEDFIIHTAEITRPSRAKDSLNQKFNSPEFRFEFYSSVLRLIEASKFQIIACAIRKDRLVDKYGSNSQDPYLLSFENLLNRIHWRSGRISPLKLCLEKRGPKEDKELNLAIKRAYDLGTKFVTAQVVNQCFQSMELYEKSTNLSGLQLIDLMVTPIGRHLVGKEPKTYGNEIPYTSVKEKIPDKCLTIFP